MGHFQRHVAYGPPCDLAGVYHCFPLVLYSCRFTEHEAVRVSGSKARKHENKFNHLAQYARIHVDTDEKKMDHFNHGLSCILQEKLYTGGYQTFGVLMNTAIATEGLQHDSQAKWKHKRVITRSSSQP